MGHEDPSDRLVARWAALESGYRVETYRGSPVENDLLIEAGTSGVLLTAPHAVAHWRDDKRKKADRFTGSLGELLAEQTGAGYLILRGSGPGDANWDERHPFKDALLPLLDDVFLVLDLHGMRDQGIDVCVGRSQGSQFVGEAADIVAASCRDVGLTVALDAPFNARRPGTVTSFVQGRNRLALQLEIAAAARNPQDLPERARALLRALITAISRLAA
jgi:N-formylglutamate amidohydrolase